MGSIHVRLLADEVVRRLKLRATANNRSLEGEARHILEEAAQDGMEEKVREFRDLSERLRKETSVLPQKPSYRLIREDRDSGHRDE